VNSLLARIEKLERQLQSLPPVQILTVIVPVHDSRPDEVIGVDANPELGIPGLHRESGETSKQFCERARRLVVFPTPSGHWAICFRGANE
jgi:hypothetical protein